MAVDLNMNGEQWEKNFLRALGAKMDAPLLARHGVVVGSMVEKKLAQWKTANTDITSGELTATELKTRMQDYSMKLAQRIELDPNPGYQLRLQVSLADRISDCADMAFDTEAVIAASDRFRNGQAGGMGRE